MQPRTLIEQLAPTLAGMAMAVVLAIAFGYSARFAPPVQAQGASGVTSPAPGSNVSGSVPIIGTAVIEPFQRYELYFKQEPSGDDAYIWFAGDTQQIVGGQLGTWETGALAPGTYSLRLRVVKTDGNYAEFFVPNISVNQTSGPTPTPTSDSPTETPIPTATFTPIAQPTPVVGVVEQPDLQPGETPTPTPEPIAIIDGTGSEEITRANGAIGTGNIETGASANVATELGNALALTRLRQQFFTGVRFSIAIFLIISAVFIARRLFQWALTRT